MVEILVALGIGVILIGGVTALITVNLRSSSESKTTQVASSITQEVIDGVKSKAEGDWSDFYALAKGPSNKYYISSSTLAIATGTEQLTIGEYTFTRYFYVENVNRTQCGVGTPTAAAATSDCANNFPLGSGSIAEDPSTQKITVMVEWTGGRSVFQTQYVSRTRNEAIRQTDWSGVGGDNSVLTAPNNNYSTASGIDTTSTAGAISTTLAGGGNLSTTANISTAANEHWAWNDMVGWIDFGYGPGNVGVNDVKMFGYA